MSPHANLHLPHCSTHGLLASAWQERRLPTSHCAREPQQRAAVNGVDRVTQVHVHAFMPAFASNRSCVNIYIVIHHAPLTYLVMHRAPGTLSYLTLKGGAKAAAASTIACSTHRRLSAMSWRTRKTQSKLHTVIDNSSDSQRERKR